MSEADLAAEAPRVSPNHGRVRDAATLVLIDRSGPVPRVLMGRRHGGHAFMPNKVVFPGGRVDPGDARVPVASALDPVTERKLTLRAGRTGPARARAIALAAVRETFEEAGLLLARDGPAPRAPKGPWRAFAERGLAPALDGLAFVARAVTPPGRSRRFDARFFVADEGAVAATVEGVVGPDAELTELVRVPLPEAAHLDLPFITRVVLREIEARLARRDGPEAPVPYFTHDRRGQLVREEL